MDRSKKSPELSLVLAFGDSEDSIGHTVRDAIRHLTALGKTFEIIAVNECSRDNSLPVLQLLAERMPDVKLTVIHRDSSGRAYCRGAVEARGHALVLLRAHAGIGPLAPLGLALHRLTHGQDVVVVPGRFLVCRRETAAAAIARTRGASADFERRFLRETELLSVLTLGSPGDATLGNPLLRLRELALGSLRKLSTNPVR